MENARGLPLKTLETAPQAASCHKKTPDQDPLTVMLTATDTAQLSKQFIQIIQSVLLRVRQSMPIHLLRAMGLTIYGLPSPALP